ncbi:alpha/beta hydrolase fold-3 domain protein [Aspergillus sclerotioniger CBS 115572]|uniref:Alpha/beta hydrolase fold-3 domain protein n=1 Tax=Aspergillus sclerotioniger CBS 115572 TaxID=1450535 RepID=A0A317XAG8_9EURO|nr:alpha/beta hydrolase fold-3 domain protein [Aspergillus sclerotioniger CBS 115572]PWY94622.1 alpha/beta hydrolase fold-3 domain protein [Aspergillus sclerotioniger CBS 115572]
MGEEDTSTSTVGRWLSQRDILAGEDSEWEQFYRRHRNIVPHLTGSIDQFRQTMHQAKMRAQQHGRPVVHGLDVRDYTAISATDVEVPLRVYKSLSPKADGAVMIYFHGGGWAMGDLDGEDNICRLLCIESSLHIVSVDYRLAPENPYPAAILDSITALHWVSDNDRTHGFDGDKIYVGGTSAGANLMVKAVVLRHLSPEIGIPIQGQLLRSPVLCSSDVHHHKMGLKSMDRYVDTPILNRQSMEQFFHWYQPGNPEHPTVSPLLSTELDRTPPSFLLICGHDPLRDEALAYADELERCRVPLRVAVYPGMPHAFWIFPELSTTKAATQDLIDGVRWLLAHSRRTS